MTDRQWRAWRVNARRRNRIGPRIIVLDEKLPAPPSSSETRRRTGFAGRPSPRHLIEIEMERRAAGGEMLETMKAESEYLAEWCAITYPDEPRVTPKTLRNSLGSYHRELKSRYPT